MSIAEDKRAERSRIRARRRAMTPVEASEARDAFTLAAPDIAGLVPGLMCLAAYLPAASEPNIFGALTAWDRAGISVLLPICRENGRMDWVRWSQGTRVGLSPLAPVPEPLGAPPADVGRAQLLVVPALALGADGTRLGQGGGYYDRFLATHPAPTLGVVFDDELLPSVPSDPWDAVLDAAWSPGSVPRSLDGKRAG